MDIFRIIWDFLKSPQFFCLIISIIVLYITMSWFALFYCLVLVSYSVLLPTV